MKKLLFALAICVTSLQASVVELKTVAEFESLMKSAAVPVVVQLEAYWCGPCQSLKATFNKVAPSYTENQVILARIDAYVNKGVAGYLQGGYPTVRVFKNGNVSSESFTGSKSESYLRQFIDSVKVAEIEEDENGAFCPLN